MVVGVVMWLTSFIEKELRQHWDENDFTNILELCLEVLSHPGHGCFKLF